MSGLAIIASDFLLRRIRCESFVARSFLTPNYLFCCPLLSHRCSLDRPRVPGESIPASRSRFEQYARAEELIDGRFRNHDSHFFAHVGCRCRCVVCDDFAPLPSLPTLSRCVWVDILARERTFDHRFYVLCFVEFDANHSSLDHFSRSTICSVAIRSPIDAL